MVNKFAGFKLPHCILIDSACRGSAAARVEAELSARLTIVAR